MSVNSYANSAFEAANSAGSYANSAFITANTANAAINTKTTINALNFLSAPSSNTQNTIFLVVDLETGTPTTRKMSLSVLSERSANFAFAAANSAGSYANSAFAAANSAGSSSVQSAFNTANAAFVTANSASVYANGAFAAANSAGSAVSAGIYANGAFVAANTADVKATSAGIYANGAFAAANSAGGAASASVYANGAFVAANSAGSYANSAFAAANAATATDATQNNSITASFNHANSSFGFANTTSNIALSFSATTILDVSNNGSSAYRFGQYGAVDNPNVSTFSATTLGFNLSALAGSHPFQIRLGDNTANFDTGLVHVSPTGTLSYGSAAQGQTSGTLFWRIPNTSVGNYKYRCSSHPSSMIGEINVANTAGIYFVYNS